MSEAQGVTDHFDAMKLPQALTRSWNVETMLPASCVLTGSVYGGFLSARCEHCVRRDAVRGAFVLPTKIQRYDDVAIVGVANPSQTELNKKRVFLCEHSEAVSTAWSCDALCCCQGAIFSITGESTKFA